MSDRNTHSAKARGFIAEMMKFAKEFDAAISCTRDQYRKFLLANQAWKCAEVHAQEANNPDVDRLIRKATKIRVEINKKFFNDCVRR